jgi:ribokinase
METQKPLDFLAIGDTVIDNFIRLIDAEVHCKVNSEECEICMRWGDKIPFESATEIAGVGNAANAAVSAARLGLRSELHAYVGRDAHGEQVLQALMKEGVGTSLIEQQEGKRTNYHFVLWFGNERTILIKHETFDYEVPKLAEPPRWLYLSSLSENALPYEEAVAHTLATWEGTKLAFQPGTFQIKFGTRHQHELYARTEIFFCNKEEAARILESQSQDIKELLRGIRALGPKIAIITDGHNGAYAMTEDSTWFIPIYPDERPPLERTGAGDAFASTIVSALALGLPLEEALLWGPINSMRVVQGIGAQAELLTRPRLEEYLAKAPEDYKLREL